VRKISAVAKTYFYGDPSVGEITPAISAGTQLRFHNAELGPIDHTVTSDVTGLFDSGTVVAGDNAQVTGVDDLAPGRYLFHCGIHATMHGVLVVV
jgi:plastocyanin